MAKAANCSTICQEFNELVDNFGITKEVGSFNRGFGSLKEQTTCHVRNQNSNASTSPAKISAAVNLTIDSETARADNATSSDKKSFNMAGSDLFDFGEILFHSLFKNFDSTSSAAAGKGDSLLENLEPSIPHKVVHVDKVIAAKAAGKDIGSVHNSHLICSENKNFQETNKFIDVQVNCGKCSHEEIKANDSLETVDPSISGKVLSLEELIAEKNILAADGDDLPSKSDDTNQTGNNTDPFQKDKTALSQDDNRCTGPTSRRGLEKYFGRGAAHKRLSCFGDAASESCDTFQRSLRCRASNHETITSTETSSKSYCRAGNQQPDLLASHNRQSTSLECNAPSEQRYGSHGNKLCHSERIEVNSLNIEMNTDSQIYNIPNTSNLNSDSEEITHGRKKRQAVESNSSFSKHKFDSCHGKTEYNDMKRLRNDHENPNHKKPNLISNNAIRLSQQYECGDVSSEVVNDTYVSPVCDISVSSTHPISRHGALIYNADPSIKRVVRTFPNQANSKQQTDMYFPCTEEDLAVTASFQVHGETFPGLESASLSGRLSLNQRPMAVSTQTTALEEWSHQDVHSHATEFKSLVTFPESSAPQSSLISFPTLSTSPRTSDNIISRKAQTSILSPAKQNSSPINPVSSFKIYPMLLVVQESSAGVPKTQLAPQTTEAYGMQLNSITNPNTLPLSNSNILLAIPIKNSNTCSNNEKLNPQNVTTYSTSTGSNLKVSNPPQAPVKTTNKNSSVLSATSLLLSLAPKPVEVAGGQKQPLSQTCDVGLNPESSVNHLPSIHGLPPCRVCGDKASGFHYGVNSCDSCNEFFRRTEKQNKTYKCLRDASCDITWRARSLCNFCRFRRCLDVGMSRAKIKPGRYSHTKITLDTLEIKQSSVTPIMSLGAQEIERKINELASLFTHFQSLDCTQPNGQCRPWKLQSFSKGHIKMFFQTYQEMVKRVPGFADLCPEDQTALAKKSWMELWILSEIKDLACPGKSDMATFDRQLWRERFGPNSLEEVLRVAKTIMEINPSDNILNLLKAIALTSSDFVALVDRARVDQLNCVFVHCLQHELDKAQSTDRWQHCTKRDVNAALVSARVQMKCALRNCELILSDSVHLQF